MPKTPPEKLAYIKEWRANNKDKVRKHRNKWNDSNKAWKNAWLRADHAKKPEKYRAKVKRNRLLHPEMHRDRLRAHAANKRAQGRVTVAVIRALRLTQPNCQICGAPSQHLDHIIACSQGGTNARENLQMLCATCNCRKALTERRTPLRRPRRRLLDKTTARTTDRLD